MHLTPLADDQRGSTVCFKYTTQSEKTNTKQSFNSERGIYMHSSSKGSNHYWQKISNMCNKYHFTENGDFLKAILC